MDIQKISEAAGTIKKVDHAETWFRMINGACSHPIDPKDCVVLDTVGRCTQWTGHSEASPYLRQAMDVYRQELINYAFELSQSDKRTAEKTIRDEVGQ